MSVLTATNSTCEMPASIIRLTRVHAAAADADDADHREIRGGVARPRLEPRCALRHRLQRLDGRLVRARAAGSALGGAARRPRRGGRLRAGSGAAAAAAPRLRRPAAARACSRRRSAAARRRPAAKSGTGSTVCSSFLRRAPGAASARSIAGLALGGLRRAEQLRERALTHARALSRHGAPPSPARGSASAAAPVGSYRNTEAPSPAPRRSARSCGSAS